ncbi:MAG: VOC family protein [Anaerolineales bacterium]|nr:VOC family protein [Anaerolineales bacterium]
MADSFDQTIMFLGTKNLAEAAEFYEQILGLELVRDQEVCRIYRTSPGSFLGFCEHLPVEEPSGGIILTLVCDDVDGWYKKLKNRGVQFEKKPQQNSEFGIYHCFFRDPDGYLLEIQRFDKQL